MAARPKRQTPRKPSAQAIKLVGSKLEDFLPLKPAEEKLRQCAAAGEDCIVDDFNGQRPAKSTRENSVRADFLRYMILGGCDKSPVSERGIRLDGAFVVCGTSCQLDLESTEIALIVFLVNCTVEGEVRLVRSNAIEINLIGSSIEALDADGLSTKNSVRLEKGFLCRSAVKLRNARIGGNLACQGGTFLDPNNAIIANRAQIVGDVDLGDVSAKGTIAFTGSEIGGNFMPQGAVLEGTPALQLRNSKIGGTLIWRGLGFVDGEVDLSGTSCKTLNTGNTSWLRKRAKYRDRDPDHVDEKATDERKQIEYHTKLDNFTYDGFSNLPDNVKSSYWIEWLKQQPDEHLEGKFKPRPWEQLATVLDSMGYEEEARDVRIEKQRLHTNFMIKHEKVDFSLSSLLHWLQIFFRTIFWGPLVSYGYRPGNALIWLFGFVLIGTVIYDYAAKQGIMTPTHPLIYKEARANGSIPSWCAENWVYFPDESCASAMPSEYSEFQSFIYAADVALPVVNLRMEEDWAPRVVYSDGTRDRIGWYVRLYEWLLISAGWILSLLFVSAVGSSIRR